MSATTTDLTTLTPAEVDELRAEAVEPAARKIAQAQDARRSANRYLKAGGYYRERGEELLAKAQEALAAAEDAYREAAAPFDAEYERRGRWPRYLLVVSSSNGHVHRGHGCCSALTPGVTLVAPVWQLSGEDDEGVVVSQGFRACSKCFPEAPVETVEDKRAANAAKGRCAGSGERATAFTPNRRYGRCPSCGGTFGVSTYGKVRPHKPEARS